MIELPENRFLVWEDVEDCIDLDWVQRTNDVGRRAAFRLDDESEWPNIEPFICFIRSLFDFEINVVSRYVGTWIKTNVSAKDPAYCEGFPHVHNNDMTTITMMVQVPEKGGELVLMGQQYPARVGTGAIMGGREEHGVKRVYGDTPRISLIAQFDRREE